MLSTTWRSVLTHFGFRVCVFDFVWQERLGVFVGVHLTHLCSLGSFKHIKSGVLLHTTSFAVVFALIVGKKSGFRRGATAGTKEANPRTATHAPLRPTCRLLRRTPERFVFSQSVCLLIFSIFFCLFVVPLLLALFPILLRLSVKIFHFSQKNAKEFYKSSAKNLKSFKTALSVDSKDFYSKRVSVLNKTKTSFNRLMQSIELRVNNCTCDQHTC
jgi:hypothetical protein